jgi:sarcosine oxidase/L-pipecolate oxidase
MSYKTSLLIMLRIQACQWALHLCKQAGVNFILHPVQGCFDGFIESGCVLNQRVLGVLTKDRVEHRADKVIVACEYGVTSLAHVVR